MLVPADEDVSLEVSGLSFGLIADRVQSVDGVQVGLIFVNTKRSLTGTQIGFGFNFADGRLKGVQLAGLANFSGVASGLQAAIGVNRADDLHGAQVGFANSVDDGRGIQMGVMNGALRFVGVRVGAANASEELEGAEIGLINSGGTISGFELGVLNLPCVPLSTDCANMHRDISGVAIGGVTVARTLSGFDLGVLNIASEARGFHVGLVNLVWNEEGESLALVNLTRTGLHEVAAYATDTMLFNLGVKLGSKHLYTVATASFQAGEPTPSGSKMISQDTHRVAAGLGLGWRFAIEWKTFVSIELELGADRMRSAWHGLPHEGPSLYHLRLIGVFRLASHLSLLVGTSIGLTTSSASEPASIGHLGTTWSQAGATYSLYPGYLLGLQM